MVELFMADRSQDWLRQSKKDLEHARDSEKNGSYDWACFAAHQAAEKAVNALHLKLHQDTRGHVISKLLFELEPVIHAPGNLINHARILDKYYIPARYPNGKSQGAPYEHYGKTQSREAIKYADMIIQFVDSKIALG
jgi:HEPN domain-containing protein